MPARLYVDVDGVSYRVYDTRFAGARQKRVALGDPSARYRVFVPEAGQRRSYAFKRGEGHGITDLDLERQLRASEYVHMGAPFDSSTMTPGAPQ